METGRSAGVQAARSDGVSRTPPRRHLADISAFRSLSPRFRLVALLFEDELETAAKVVQKNNAVILTRSKLFVGR